MGNPAGDLVHLIALRPEGAPDETLEQWHLQLKEGVPEAAKFYAHEGPIAHKVRNKFFAVDKEQIILTPVSLLTSVRC